MALDDIYDIQHRMTIFGTNIRNSYQVFRANVGENASSVSDSFQNDILPVLRAFQSDAVVNVDMIVKNLGDVTDFGTFSLSSAVGNRAGADLASFNAGGLVFPRLRSDMRQGNKRFVGLLETDVLEQNIQAAALVLLNNIGAALVADWTSSIDSHSVANMIIVKRVCEQTDPVTGKCLEYRLPKIGETPIFYQPIQGTAYVPVRSQVSRRVSAS